MRLTVKIDGMSCHHCVRAVRTALAGVEGIESADVGIGGAIIEHDGRVTLEAVRDAVRVAGYEVEGGEEERRRLRVL
ncbi:MAG TPA: heavy-metal-associated domain-containing protein [Gemmatimonadaceae bacterium]|nr:heavy-metal-associated domain-containing protein [Gemmatimonadaceae bacterium]